MAQKIKNEQEIVETMEEFLAMFKFERNKMEQNTNMSDEETKQICDLCYRLKKDGETAGYYEELYEECRNVINDMLKTKNYQPVNPSKNSKKVATGITRIPHIIKLLIYYMAYRAFELYDAVLLDSKSSYKKPSQNEILDFIGKVRLDANGKKIKSKKPNGKGYQCQYDGYRLSNKTFTYLGVSPSIYCRMNNYKQIELPLSYAGAKVFYLGYCINWLTACAGTYDIFLDLFGGSASASMAVDQLDTSDYYINEYDFFVVNYYNVIADDELFKEYKKKLEKKVKKLHEVEYHVPIAKDYFVKYEEVEKAWREKYSMNNPQILENNIVTDGNYRNYATETDKEKVKAAWAFTFMQSFQTTGGHCDKGAISETKLRKFCSLSIDDYVLFHNKMKRMKEKYNSDALGTAEFVIEYLTDKAPTRYAKVEQVSKDIRSGKKLFKNCSKEEKALLRLLGGTEKKKPRPFRTLIYSDSPYLETAGYKAGEIDETTMKNLIERLVKASSKGSHFIFSCRAGKSIEELKYSQIAEVMMRIEYFPREENQIKLDFEKVYTDGRLWRDEFGNGIIEVKAESEMKSVLNLLRGNHAIYENIFKEFERYKKGGKLSDCKVLVCIDEKNLDKSVGKSSEEKIIELVKKMYVVEVFITDYDFIVPAPYKYTTAKEVNKSLKGTQDFTFEKYEIGEFCELLDNNMFKSKDVQSVKVKKCGDGYIFQ